MKSNIVRILTTLVIAFAILSVSVLKSATTKNAYSPTNYVYTPIVLSERTTSEKVDSESIDRSVDYLLAYPGKINPDNPLWYLKVIRDKAWYTFTFNLQKKIELNLLFADKRLSSSLILLKNNKPDLGVVTLTKAEKYLEKAVPSDASDGEYLKKLAIASLKHRQVIETEILPITPEDLRPEVIRMSNYSYETYKKVRDLMLSKGLIPPENVFDLK